MFLSIYLQGKRLDKLLFLLLKISRDTAFDRLTKRGKGKARASRIAGITSIAEISLEYVSQCAPENWAVLSATGSAKTYNVTEKMKSSCCSITCDCGTCLHQFSCDCIDGLMADTVRKHMHLVSQWNKKKYGHKPVESCKAERESLRDKVMGSKSVADGKKKSFDELSKLHSPNVSTAIMSPRH